METINNITRAALLVVTLVLLTLNEFNMATVILAPITVFLAYSAGKGDGLRQGFRRGAKKGIEAKIDEFVEKYEKTVAESPVQFFQNLIEKGLITAESLNPRRKKETVKTGGGKNE